MISPREGHDQETPRGWSWLTTALLGALVVAIALALRLQGTRYGLPYQTDIDEPLHLTGALRIAAFETADHQCWTYPAFFFYVLAAEFVAARWLLGLSPVLLQSEFPIYHLAGRFLIVAIGTAAVALTIAWTARALRSRTLGLIAGLCMAVFPLAVRESQIVTTNALASLVALGALIATLEAHDRGSTRGLLVAAGLAGLAASTKYNAGTVVLAPLVVALARTADPLTARVRIVGTLAAVSMVTFLMGTPLLPLRIATFVPAMGELAHHYSTGHISQGPAHSYVPHLVTLSVQLGPGGAALFVVGLASLIASGRRGLAVWTFPVGYFLFAGWFPVDFPRTLLPIGAFVALAVAAGFERALRVGRAHWPGKVVAGLALLALAHTVAQASLNTSEAQARIAHDAENQIAAKEWAEAHLPAGARIVGEWHCPPLNEWPASRTFELRYRIFAMTDGLPELGGQGVRYVIESGQYQRLVANAESARPGTYHHRVRRNYEDLHRSGRLLATFDQIRFWELPR